MRDNNEREWLKIGAEVAALTPGRMMGSPRVAFSTVLRIGKRDVVLADDQRFPVSTLQRRNGTWDPPTVLLPASAPKVAEAVAEARRAHLVSRARGACDDFLRRKPGVTAFDVILALAPLTGCADEIAALDNGAKS